MCPFLNLLIVMNVIMGKNKTRSLTWSVIRVVAFIKIFTERGCHRVYAVICYLCWVEKENNNFFIPQGTLLPSLRRQLLNGIVTWCRHSKLTRASSHNVISCIFIPACALVREYILIPSTVSVFGIFGRKKFNSVIS